MSRPAHRVAEAVTRFAAEFRERHAVGGAQRKALLAMVSCRTAALGGHLEQCSGCGHERPAYNSCRNRHCPSCQGAAARAWVEARSERVLPVGHFHVVFTLPAELRPFFAVDRAVMYDLLLRSASTTLVRVAERKWGATLGLTAVLHTWNQSLSFHPHVHCIVSGGGLSRDGRWVASRAGYLLPVKWLRSLFRGVFLRELRDRVSAGTVALPPSWPPVGAPLESRWRSLRLAGWVVYAKRPFAGTEGAIEYIGRYTHRVGISDHRILDVGEETVTFSRRDAEPLVLPGVEFVRRLLLHVLPAGFRKIRHYGLYAPSVVRTRLAAALAAIHRQGLATPYSEAERRERVEAREETARVSREEQARCPNCGEGRMCRTTRLQPAGWSWARGPPVRR